MKTLSLIIALFFAVTSQAARLTWVDNSDNENGFEIERASNPTGAFVRIASVGPNVTTYADTTPVPGASYIYRVRAFNAAGSSGYTNSFTWEEPALPPLNPATNLKAASVTVGATTWSAVFTWTDTNTAETGYRLEYRKQEQSDDAWLTSAQVGANIVRAATPSYSDLSSSFEWRVVAIGAGVTGPPSATVTTGAALSFLPTAPATLNVTK